MRGCTGRAWAKRAITTPAPVTAPATISEAELMQRTGLTQRAALKRELTRLRIRYFSSRGGVWTTTAALEARGLIQRIRRGFASGTDSHWEAAL